jgi:hypothetical protein
MLWLRLGRLRFRWHRSQAWGREFPFSESVTRAMPLLVFPS